MKVVINLWILRNKQLDGIGYYCINLFKEFIQQNPQWIFILLLPTNYNENYFDFPNVKKIKVFPPFRHPLLYFFWLEIVLPIYFLFLSFDILISGDGMLSLNSSKTQIPIIYDLNFRHFPSFMDFKNRFFYNTFFPKYIRKAKKIITISEFSKKDIVESFSYPIDNIDVVYANSNISINDNIDHLKIKQKFSQGEEYFFTVGSILPRKNLKNQILAFIEFRENNKNAKCKFLISGKPLWGKNEFFNQILKSNFSNDIVFLGRLSDDDLVGVMSSCIGLSYVSLFEGFGMPILEGFRCKVPVITSNVTSMPEIAKDAAICVNPNNISEIAKMYQNLYFNVENIRETLIKKGEKRAQDFSWNKSAKKLTEIITTN